MMKINTFLLAGVPRCGKSHFRKKVLNKHRIPGITTDLLRDGLTIGVPSFGSKETGQTDRQKQKFSGPFGK